MRIRIPHPRAVPKSNHLLDLSKAVWRFEEDETSEAGLILLKWILVFLQRAIDKERTSDISYVWAPANKEGT